MFEQPQARHEIVAHVQRHSLSAGHPNKLIRLHAGVSTRGMLGWGCESSSAAEFGHCPCAGAQNSTGYATGGSSFTLVSNYTTAAITVASAATRCVNANPGFPVVEATISSVRQVCSDPMSSPLPSASLLLSCCTCQLPLHGAQSSIIHKAPGASTLLRYLRDSAPVQAGDAWREGDLLAACGGVPAGEPQPPSSHTLRLYRTCTSPKNLRVK